MFGEAAGIDGAYAAAADERVDWKPGRSKVKNAAASNYLVERPLEIL